VRDAPAPASDERELLRRTAQDVERARREIDTIGALAIPRVRTYFETAIARLGPLTASDDVPGDVRRIAERCRLTLSSHLLAAEDLEAAGMPLSAVAMLLRRATDSAVLTVRADG
jgi:hypothetical protein